MGTSDNRDSAHPTLRMLPPDGDLGPRTMPASLGGVPLAQILEWLGRNADTLCQLYHCVAGRRRKAIEVVIAIEAGRPKDVAVATGPLFEQARSCLL